MKQLCVTACLLMLSLMSYSQGYYEIKTLGGSYSAETINNAFSTANFCGYHKSSERNLIVFNDGTEVELFSADEIQNFNSNCILVASVDTPICEYSIVSGVIMRACENKLTPFEEKIKVNN